MSCSRDEDADGRSACVLPTGGFAHASALQWLLWVKRQSARAGAGSPEQGLATVIVLRALSSVVASVAAFGSSA